jgi:hypothetical protein
MNLKQLRARVSRLEELSAGLAREETQWRQEIAFLMHSERALYLNAIANARRGVEAARSTLANVCQRLEARALKRPAARENRGEEAGPG